MGCGNSKSVTPVETTTANSTVPQTSPVAFEIGLEDVSTPGESDGKDLKKPPRRLERLVNESGPIITSEDVEEKLRRAEERRQEIIEERVKNSRLLAEKMKARVTTTTDETDPFPDRS